MVKKLKTYQELANERHEMNKTTKADRLAVELAKIEAANQRQRLNLEHKDKEQKQKRTTGAISAVLGVVGFVVILGILYGFAALISKT